MPDDHLTLKKKVGVFVMEMLFLKKLKLVKNGKFVNSLSVIILILEYTLKLVHQDSKKEHPVVRDVNKANKLQNSCRGCFYGCNTI
jgi:hypothetical protein